MLRLLLLGLLLFSLVTGVSHGWIELRWDRFFRDAGVPLFQDGPAPAQPAGSGSGAPARSSARQAPNPSR
jgi:hypothetical protein